MGLKKIKHLSSGYDAEYWRVVRLNNSFDAMDSVIHVGLYKDKIARDAGAAPVYVFSHALGAAFSERLFTGTGKVKDIKLTEAYKELKAQAVSEAEKLEEDRNAELAFLADAEDIL